MRFGLSPCSGQNFACRPIAGAGQVGRPVCAGWLESGSPVGCRLWLWVSRACCRSTPQATGVRAEREKPTRLAGWFPVFGRRFVQKMGLCRSAPRAGDAGHGQKPMACRASPGKRLKDDDDGGAQLFPVLFCLKCRAPFRMSARLSLSTSAGGGMSGAPSSVRVFSGGAAGTWPGSDAAGGGWHEAQ
jgi:hypothetical protein